MSDIDMIGLAIASGFKITFLEYRKKAVFDQCERDRQFVPSVSEDKVKWRFKPGLGCVDVTECKSVRVKLFYSQTWVQRFGGVDVTWLVFQKNTMPSVDTNI
jgi:hypothetical protein